MNLELYILYNACMDGLMLALAAKLTGLFVAGKRSLMLRIVLASISGALFSAAAVSWTRPSIPYLIPGLGVMVFIAYGTMSIRAYIRVFGLVFALSCLTGGGGMLLLSQFGGLWTPQLAVGLFAVAVFMARCVFGYRRRAVRVGSMRKLTMDSGCGTRTFTALIDSGNTLVEPVSGLPVVVLSNKVYSISPKLPGYRLVPYHTVSGSGIMPCFRPGSLYIDDKPLLAYVAVSESHIGVEALVPPAALAQGAFTLP